VPKKRGPTSIDGAADEAPSKKRSAAKIANGFTAVNDNTNDNVEEPITPKRRAPRTTAPGKAKNSEEYDDATIDAPITPPSKRASPQKAANGKITTNGEGSEEIFSPTKSISNGIQGVNVRGTPRKRQAPKEKAASPVKIPNSWEEADAADRMLVTMKDEGKSWDDIRKTWKTMTDQDTAAR